MPCSRSPLEAATGGSVSLGAHRVRRLFHLEAETWFAAAAVELHGAGVHTSVRVDPACTRAARGEIEIVEWYHDEPQWGLLPMRGTCRKLG